MGLTVSEDQSLTEILGDLEQEYDKLKPGFQQNFVRDQIERHRKYGAEIFLSPKQWKILRELHDEYVGTGDGPEPDEVA